LQHALTQALTRINNESAVRLFSPASVLHISLNCADWGRELYRAIFPNLYKKMPAMQAPAQVLAARAEAWRVILAARRLAPLVPRALFTPPLDEAEALVQQSGARV
jgi:hypothetical protein